MGKPVISIQDLGKSYRLGHKVARHSSFREAMTAAAAAPLRNLRRRLVEPSVEHETFWALKDVSFDVGRGEVIGIVGSNGAGKSTLLKIISRIVEPTTGRVVIRGRVASLLEVGTGFHPELTGRENIFLNGSILGMRRSEIVRKFDEIVDFSEVGQFIDTPVKRYSSGMYVRLAFAVAAHLEPEVLIVDEVLAVGDAEFQRKCLGKMEQVATGEGRTVLFVSHNMSAVQKLCSRAVLMRKGRLVSDGKSEQVVREYLTNLSNSAQTSLSGDNPERGGNGKMRLTAARIVAPDGQTTQRVVAGEDMLIELKYRNHASVGRCNVLLTIFNHMGVPVTTLDAGICNYTIQDLGTEGTISVRVPRAPFPIGQYRVAVSLDLPGETADQMPNLLAFEVETSVFYDTPRTHGLSYCTALVEHHWDHRPAGSDGGRAPVGAPPLIRAS